MTHTRWLARSIIWRVARLQGVIDVDQHPSPGDGCLSDHRGARFGRRRLVHCDEAIAEGRRHAVLTAAGAVVAVDDDQGGRRAAVVRVGVGALEEGGVGWQVGIEGRVAQQCPQDARLHDDHPG